MTQDMCLVQRNAEISEHIQNICQDILIYVSNMLDMYKDITNISERYLRRMIYLKDISRDLFVCNLDM